LLFGNRYRVEETLGRGGAGIVYRAFDLNLERPVALKALETSRGELGQSVERLRREAALLSRLAHPNIVGFYDLGEEAGRPYLVLEYVAGCTLRALLETYQAPLPLEIANHIISGVLVAVDTAHQADITHRDLKPENIMLVGVEPEIELDPAAPPPQVKVMDFGLAYLSGETRITGENLVAGTALYMAPEAALGQTVDGRADLYAIGLIWYEMAAGRPPFRGHESLALISQHLHATPISPRWHNANVSPALASIILKLLAKTPADRYQTAAEVLAELETVQHSGGEDRPLTSAALLEAIARGRLVGRDQEMALLRKATEAMLHGSGGVIFIEGEPGIGKTRLVNEASLYARLKGAQVFTGRCYDAELTLPYQPFIEVVKSYAQTQIKAGSTGALPAGLAAELVRFAPGLEAHLGVAAAPSEVSPAEARLRLFEAVATLFTNGPEPLVLILENLHWASPPDLALLHHLAQSGPRRRLLLVVTYQGGQAQPGSAQALARLLAQLNRANLATHLRLQPLSVESTTLLLETLLEGEVTPDFSQAIFAVTEGNPFFVEEILKALTEAGRIFRDPARGRWAGVNLERLAIPASLKEVMSQRFEKLSRQQRRLLNLAALLGRRFRVETLAAAAEVGEDALMKSLEKGVRMQLIRRVEPSESSAEAEVYAFEHSLIRQTLSESLNARQRARLHRQIGQALEQLNRSQPQALASPDELAYHFSLAGGDDREKAIQYSLIAAEHALEIYASEVAVKHYHLILDLLEGDPDVVRRAWVLEQLGDLYFQRTRQMVDAVATYEWAIQLWQTAPEPDPAALIRLYQHIGEIARHWQGRVERLEAYLAEALRLLDQDPTQAESLERARVLAAMALNLHARPETQRDAETALKLAQSAADMAARLDSAAEEAMALDALQRIYRAQGNLAAAHETDRRRLALIPRMLDPTEVVETHLGASQMGWETGDLGAASQACLEALTMARRTDNLGGQWEALRRLVILHLQWGKLSGAVAYARQGVALGPRAGWLEFGEPVEALFRTHLAILYTLQDQAEAAARELAELSALYPTPEAPPYRFALGWLHYEVEAWDEAMLTLEDSQAFPTPFLPGRFEQMLLLEIYGHLGDELALAELGPAAEAEARRWNLPYLLAIFQRGYGAFYAEQGDWDEAEAAFKRALAVTRGKSLWYQDARTWLDYGRMLIRRNQPGDTGLGRDFLSEARGMFLSFGANALAEKAWIELARLAQ
jgi:tetratricopeptide (TPR) repeat protein